MRLLLRALAPLLLFALSAHAWEPASPAAVQARIEELQKAWAGKSPEEVAQDKAARARQPRPQWASRSAWKMELGPITYYFAVGKASFQPAVSTAQADAPSSAGRPLDWWFDEVAGTLYTLVVEAR